VRDDEDLLQVGKELRSGLCVVQCTRKNGLYARTQAKFWLIDQHRREILVE